MPASWWTRRWRGHTLRLVGLPALMRQWVAALDAMLAKHRHMARLYRGAYRKDAVGPLSGRDHGRPDEPGGAAAVARTVPLRAGHARRGVEHSCNAGDAQRVGTAWPPGAGRWSSTACFPRNPNCPACAEWTLRAGRCDRGATRVFSRYIFWGLPLFLEEVRGTERLLTCGSIARPLAQAKGNAERER